MTTSWAISDRLLKFIADGVREYDTRHAIDFAFYPGIWWTLEGFAYKEDDPQGTRIDIPARYGIVIIDRANLPEGVKQVLVPDNKFGFVSLCPREEDLASTRRMFDLDGENLVVR